MDNEKQLSSQFWQYLISAILIALSGCLGNVVDGIIVGNLINSDGVSAINLSRPVVQFLFTLSLLIAGGAGMLVGFALGRDDQRRTRYVYTQAMIGNAVLGCIVAMAGFLFPDTLARMLCNNEHLYPMALSYLRIVLLGAPAYLFAWSLSTLIGVDNVICMPHLGACTPESEERSSVMAAHEMYDYLVNGNIKNSVNFPDATLERMGTSRLCILHFNKPTMLNQFLQIACSTGLNVENMINKAYRDYAYAMIDLNGELSKEQVEALKSIPDVIRVRVV